MAKYIIVYNWDGADYEVETCVEEFVGSWNELYEYIRQMRNNGCYNIEANEVYDGDNEDGEDAEEE